MKSTLLGGGWAQSYGFSRVFLALAGVMVLSAGCADDAVPGMGSTTGGATDGTSSGATPGTTNGTMPGTTAGTPDAGTTTGGNSGGTNAGTSAGTGTTAGTTAGMDEDDAGMMAGSGDIPTTPGNDSPAATACSDTDTCSYATQTCCVSGVGDAMCVEGKKCPSGGLIPAAPTVCDGPEDCMGNKVCCVAVNPTGATNSCQDSCDKVSGLIGVWQLCHKDADCPAAKGACEADDTFPFWGFCG